MADRIEVAVNIEGAGRREALMGKTFRVFPATLVQSQILHNNLGVTFLPADAITKEWADTANAAPVVTVHPKRRGSPVSARDPHILNAHGAGFLFATQAKDGALTGEVWLDAEAPERIEGMGAVFERLDAGETVELSTGFPVSVEDTPGAHNGEAFERIIRPAGFDHLAVFTDGTRGACSVSDGCGLAANHEGPCEADNEEEPVDEETQGRLATVLDKLTAFLSRAEAPAPDSAEDGSDEPDEPAANTSKEDDEMNREQMIAQLAEAGPLDREALNKLSDCQLRALAQTDGDQSASQNAGGDSEAWKLAHKYRAELEELKERTKSAVENEEQERTRLLDDCLYARNRAWSDEELEAMDIVELRKVHRTMFPEPASYAGRGGPRASNAGVDFGFVRPVLGTGSVLNEKEAN